ncbi:hypothetical protein HDU97_007997 [Phlyctochytrium planicorne]|nr:hypothetical protein HDU97_007997 [Phlyctochytrium planicorne]
MLMMPSLLAMALVASNAMAFTAKGEWSVKELIVCALESNADLSVPSFSWRDWFHLHSLGSLAQQQAAVCRTSSHSTREYSKSTRCLPERSLDLSSVAIELVAYSSLPLSHLNLSPQPPHDEYNLLNPNTGGYTSTLTDLNSDTLTPTILKDLYSNPFCAGHSQAADGGIWVMGGDRQPSNDSTIGFYLQPGIFGRRKFDVNTGTWENESKHGNMTGGARWYPTVVTLFDESVIIISGTTSNLDFDDLGKNKNPTYEYYPTSDTNAKNLDILLWAYPHSLYPIAFQLPSKKIFLMVSNRTITIDKENNDNIVDLDTLVADGKHEPWIYPNSPTATILPMYESEGYKMTIMACGGVQRNNGTLASSACWAIEPETPGAKWEQMPDMPHGRLMPDSVLLPDGSILYTNGARWGVAGGNGGQAQYAAGPWFDTDVYNPKTKTWTANVGKSSVPRLYHSGALLLSDASVITTGSEMQNYVDYWGTEEGNIVKPDTPLKPDCWPIGQQACTNAYETRVERFVPPYMTSGVSRPAIKSAPEKASHGSTIIIEVDPAVKISSLALIRYTTTTHNTNTDQRFLGPNLLFNNGTHIIFKIPASTGLAPPGNYHLFAVTADGIPSVAKTVLIRAGTVTTVDIPTGGNTPGGNSATVSTTGPNGKSNNAQAKYMKTVSDGFLIGVIVAGLASLII